MINCKLQHSLLFALYINKEKERLKNLTPRLTFSPCKDNKHRAHAQIFLTIKFNKSPPCISHGDAGRGIHEGMVTCVLPLNSENPTNGTSGAAYLASMTKKRRFVLPFPAICLTLRERMNHVLLNTLPEKT